MIKRGFDILGATIALVVLSPLLAGVAAFVALRLGRPVLFAQAAHFGCASSEP
jgi:lipopolysaccharide/colanic/teichoic acid biosynthesis glycosyltransferase